jgi:hypothetical protein
MRRTVRYLSRGVGVVGLVLMACRPTIGPGSASDTVQSFAAASDGLWSVYDESLKEAKYVDLTHTLTASAPVWKGFGPSTFEPALNPDTGTPYRYAQDGFEATRYNLSTDQFGTQLDPPAHWAPEYPAIDELPATYAVRPIRRRHSRARIGSCITATRKPRV